MVGWTLENVEERRFVLHAPHATRSRLTIPTALFIDSPKPRPNPWRRFWHWLLLGWTWEVVP